MTHCTIKFYYDANKIKIYLHIRNLSIFKEYVQIVHPRNILEATLDTNINHMAAPTFH